MALSFGLLANSVPVAFWAIYYMYSDASLLAEVREGIDSVVGTSSIGSSESSEHEKLVIKVNIKEVMERYPLLRWFVSEVLRLQTTNVSPRIVQEDTIIGGRYLLKKGNIVMMPSVAAHRDPNAWGSSATEFDPERFVSQQQKGAEHDHGSPGQRKVPVASHRSWGRGGIVCPGRHFAVNELIVMLVMMVVKYDVIPLSGQWKFPKAKVLVVANILAPLEPIQASIKVRAATDQVDRAFVWE